MMNKEKFLSTGLLEQYVLGLTSQEENERVKQYLKEYPELQEEVKAMHSALEVYARQYAVPPPKEVKHRIIEDIESLEKQTKEVNISVAPPFAWKKWVSYAALLLLTAGFFFQNRVAKQARAELMRTQTDLSLCQNDNTSLQAKQQIIAFLKHPHTQPIILKGTGRSPESKAVVYWNEAEQLAYFNASRLPNAPKGKQYQIWADVNGEMISIGLLDDQPGTLQIINYIANAESLNVTLEPKGGSEHPTVADLFVNAPTES